MVLPSDDHWALRGWLRSHGIPAGERGGTLIVGNLDGLLALAGSPRRLTQDEHSVVKAAGAW